MKSIFSSAAYSPLALFMIGASIAICLETQSADLDESLVLRLRFDEDAVAEPETYFTAVNGHVEYIAGAIDGSCLNLSAANGGYVTNPGYR